MATRVFTVEDPMKNGQPSSNDSQPQASNHNSTAESHSIDPSAIQRWMAIFSQDYDPLTDSTLCNLFIPQNGSTDYATWTSQQVSEWMSNFFPAQVVANFQHLHGRDLFSIVENSEHEQDPSKFFKLIVHNIKLVVNAQKERVVTENLRFDYLLLENHDYVDGFRQTSDQCFMNVICNLLYSCKDFRDMFQEYGPSEKKNLITEIFLGGTNSSRKWRKVLEPAYHTGHQSICEVFVLLMRDLAEEIPKLPMQFDFSTDIKCTNCLTTTYGNADIRESNDLVIGDADTFFTALDKKHKWRECRGECQCGGSRLKRDTITALGQYHFMSINCHYKSPIDFNSDATVSMYGLQWKLISFAEYIFGSSNGTSGHFRSWIRRGEKWTCINDCCFRQLLGQNVGL